MHQQIADLSSDTSVPCQPTLALWEAEMRQAVHAERDGRATLALAGYERALSIAHRLLEAPPAGRVDDCLAALVVAHHNLADLHVAQGAPDRAAPLLCRAHAVLIALTQAVDRPASLRQAALRHSRETYVALIRHLARHGPHPLIARTIADGDAALHPSHTARH